ncbi:MAG: hypothetical protein ACF8GE_04725 [Phycisphaerales bacterium JB043]
MSRSISLSRFVRVAIVGATLGCSALVAPASYADGTRAGVSFRIPLGDHGALRLGYRDGYGHRHDRYDDRRHHRRSWGSRLNHWFDELGGGRRDARRALRGFERLASERPRAPLPKVGIAIASLRLGREGDAIYAMRRAIRINPGALHRVPVRYDLYDDLHRIEKRLKRQGRHDYNSADEWFLIASLRVVAGHDGKARRAIRYALDQGDRSRATVELARYLGVRMHRDRDRHARRGGHRDYDDDRRRPRRGRRR